MGADLEVLDHQRPLVLINHWQPQLLERTKAVGKEIIMEIFEMTAPDADICRDLNTLMPQLSETAPKLTVTDLERIISSDGGALIVAMDAGAVLGCVTLSVFPVLTDIRGWIDDLVVRSDERDQGIGRQLVEYAMKKARVMGARSVNLTCNPQRRSANALYRRMGFQQRESNIYHHRT